MLASLERFDWEALIDGVFDELRPQAEQKQLELRKGATVATTFASDSRLVRLALCNLVTNAIKFTTRGIVEVSLVRAEGAHVLTVRDTGPGIPAEARTSVFEAFVQLASRGEEARSGVGFVHRDRRHPRARRERARPARAAL